MLMKNTSLDDIAPIVGFSATIRLSAYYGNANMMVPKEVSEKHTLAKIIGMSAARLLCAEMGGTTVSMPSLHLAEVELRNAKVLKMLTNGVFTVHEIAKLNGITLRRVQQLRTQFEAEGLLEKRVSEKSGKK